MKPLLCLALALFVSTTFAAEPVTLKLWPEGVPGEITVKPPDPKAKPNPNVVTNVTEPTLTIYQPEKPSGTAIIVAPGGGYRFLSIKHEGTQVCEWLNSIGVTAALLTYRTPTNEEATPYDKPVQDAQRAIGLLRHHAAEWGLQRVGLLGFSAGGNLLGHAALDRTDRTYPVKAESDSDQFRPDFAVMIYGGGFLDPNDKTKFRSGFSVPPDAPLAFFLVAHDDKQIQSRSKSAHSSTSPTSSSIFQPNSTSAPKAATASACGRMAIPSTNGLNAAPIGCKAWDTSATERTGGRRFSA